MVTTARKSDSAPPADDVEGPAFPISSHPSLPMALLAAQRLIAGGVAKSGTAEVETRAGGKYTYRYASGEDMVAGCRAALLAVGLLWTLESYEIDYTDDLAMYIPTFLLEHPESDSVGEKGRRYRYPMPISMAGAADKALAGARTYANSYALRDVLLVPRPDANEPDKRRSDDGAGSWRGRKSEPAAERKPDPREKAGADMQVAWKRYQTAMRTTGTDPKFADAWRQMVGKTWPGAISKCDVADVETMTRELDHAVELIADMSEAEDQATKTDPE